MKRGRRCRTGVVGHGRTELMILIGTLALGLALTLVAIVDRRGPLSDAAIARQQASLAR